jgi:hypothetical protein
MLAGMQLDLFTPLKRGSMIADELAAAQVVWGWVFTLRFGVKAIGVSFEIVQGSGVFHYR